MYKGIHQVIKLSCLLFIGWVVFPTGQAQHIQLKFSGDWSLKVDSDDIQEAGLDFPSTLTSDEQEARIKIRKNPKKQLFPWRVDIRYDEDIWDDQMEIWIRRTSDGDNETPGASIYGGTVFQLVTPNDEYFFEGEGSIKDIYIQFQLSGISVVIPVDDYKVNIVATVTET